MPKSKLQAENELFLLDKFIKYIPHLDGKRSVWTQRCGW
jgi:hypothetical protein